MKIQTMLVVGGGVVGTSVALADTSAMNHFDVVQDELWHSAETASFNLQPDGGGICETL